MNFVFIIVMEKVNCKKIWNNNKRNITTTKTTISRNRKVRIQALLLFLCCKTESHEIFNRILIILSLFGYISWGGRISWLNLNIFCATNRNQSSLFAQRKKERRIKFPWTKHQGPFSFTSMGISTEFNSTSNIKQCVCCWPESQKTI